MLNFAFTEFYEVRGPGRRQEKTEKPGRQSLEGGKVTSRPYRQSDRTTTEDEQGIWRTSVIFHKGAYAMIEVRGNGDRRGPRDMKRARPEALSTPS
jgi:hypothetical protein